MPERERLGEGIVTEQELCTLAARWMVALDTIRRVWFAAQDFTAETGTPVFLISGWRSRAQQRRLSRAGRPTAPDSLSTHRSCPATGVDVSLGVLPSNFQKARWGHFTLVHGLRWGGGGEVFESGIPKDWGHVDTGPRT